ncbi:unnamed protein product [Urochloa humidicola]
MHARSYKEGRMAAAVRSLLDRRRSRSVRGAAAAGSGAKARVAPAGCFSVYVGAGRERFVLPVERANHPLFRRLLDDAELEYGYAAEGPIALPGCDVGAFLDALWQMEHDGADDDEEDGGGEGVVDVDTTAAVMLSASLKCGLIPRSGGGNNGGRRAGGWYYRTLSPRSRSSLRRWPWL